MPIIRVQLTVPTTYNNLGMPSPQPLPQQVDTEGKTVDEYVDYYRRAGIGVQVLDVVAAQTSAVTQLQAFGAGTAPAPAGWQAGHEERPMVLQTNIPGSPVPVQNLGDPDHTMSGPFGTYPGGGNPPATAGAISVAADKSATKFLILAAVLYFVFWK